MSKPFPYKDSHCVPQRYDVTLISTRIGKEEVCSNVSSGLSELTRSGRRYTSEELEKRRKKIGKGMAELVRNRVTTKEAEEFLKTIQQLNISLVQISILALLLSFEVHCEALLKVLMEMHVPTGIKNFSFEGMVLLVLATNQVSFSDDKLPPKGKDHTLTMHIYCSQGILPRN